VSSTTTLRTTGCASSGHPEFTLQLARELVPGLAQTLASYLEGQVARGTRFAPGETIQFGWSTLRVLERTDGTLGLEERTDPATWAESVDQALHQTWSQKEVAASLGLADRLAFPRQDQISMVARCALETSRWVLVRLPVDDAKLSGWSLACAEDHDHGNRACPPLLDLSVRFPFVTQFLALPAGVAVLVLGPGRIKAHAWLDGQELTPVPGSYLAALNRST
jgi:hypothetical protein